MSLEEIKSISISIFHWIFYVSDLLTLFMIYFKYGLISSIYSLIDSVLFLSPLLSYSIYLLLQDLHTDVIYWTSSNEVLLSYAMPENSYSK